MNAPLRITINLATPIVESDQPRHLDGLVAWAMFQEAQADGSFTGYDELHDSLPFEREERPEGWVYKASFLAEMGRSGLSQRWLSRKFWQEGFAAAFAEGNLIVGAGGAVGVPTDPMTAVPRPKQGPIDKQLLQTGVAAGKIDTARNHQKAAGFLYPVAHVDRLVAFCVGNKEIIERLLVRHVTHVGKRFRLQHGQVRSIQVDDDPTARFLWSQRFLPWQERDDDVPTECPMRPPYWKRPLAVTGFRPAIFIENL